MSLENQELRHSERAGTDDDDAYHEQNLESLLSVDNVCL